MISDAQIEFFCANGFVLLRAVVAARSKGIHRAS